MIVARRIGPWPTVEAPRVTVDDLGVDPTQRFLVALNYSSRSVPFGLRDGTDGDAVLELSTDAGRDLGPIDTQVLVLGPDEGVILRLP